MTVPPAVRGSILSACWLVAAQAWPRLYRTSPSRADHPEGPVARWDVYELIVRVLDHLPAPNQQMTRYWGFYSNVARGKRRAAARRFAADLDPDEDNLSDAGATTRRRCACGAP